MFNTQKFFFIGYVQTYASYNTQVGVCNLESEQEIVAIYVMYTTDTLVTLYTC